MRLRKIARAIAVTMAVIVGAGIGPVMIPSGAVLAAVPAGAELNIDSTSVLSEGTVENASGEGWTYDSETNTLALTDYSGESIKGSSLGDLIITVENQCTVNNGIDLSSGPENNITIKGIDYGTLILRNTNGYGLYVQDADLTIGTGDDYLWFEADVSSTDNSQDVNGGVFAIKSDGTTTVNSGTQMLTMLHGENYGSPSVGTGGAILATGGIVINNASVNAVINKDSGIAHGVSVGSGATISVNGDSWFSAECNGNSSETTALGITNENQLVSGSGLTEENNWGTNNSTVLAAKQIDVAYPVPDITTAPRSATYYYGATAAPISITAANKPGVTGSLRYEWFKGRNESNVNWINTNGSVNYITPSTTTIGRTYYKVFVNSGNYGRLTSRAVTVDVKVPTPSKTGITKIYKSGSKNLILKWKKISNATGYKIYMATKKKGTYKLVKTVNKNSVTSYKKTKLKKGKTYYFKIKTYRTIQNVTAISGYSAMKYKKR